VRIVGLCLALLASGCANRVASAPVVMFEQEECTGLVRELVLKDINQEAALKKCNARAEAAEKKAANADWMSRWGMPVGAGIMALVMGGITALIVGAH